MRLLAISDLHLGSPTNRDALAELGHFPEDWLILAGDVAESFRRIGEGLTALRHRFAKVIWVPGNHELWAVPRATDLRGEARYAAMPAVGADTEADQLETVMNKAPGTDLECAEKLQKLIKAGYITSA